MVLSDGAAAIYAALITAIVGATVTLFVWWRQTRSPRHQRRVKDAWQKQAEALDDRLRREYERQLADKDSQIAYFKELLERRQNAAGGNAHD